MAVPALKDVFIEAQSGVGSAATLVAAHAIQFDEFEVVEAGPRSRKRPTMNSSTRNAARSITDRVYYECNWSVPFHEPATGGTFTSCHLADLIKSCPILTQDATPGAGQCLITPEMDFVEATTPVPISILVAWPNLAQVQVNDAYSIISSLSAEVGAPLIMSGQSLGKYAAPAAYSLTSPVYTNERTDLPKLLGSSVVITETGVGALTIGCVKSINLETGMRISPRTCASQTYGYTTPMVDHGGESKLTIVVADSVPGTTNWKTIAHTKAAHDIVIPFSDGTEIQIDVCTLATATRTVVDEEMCMELVFDPEGADWWKVETN